MNKELILVRGRREESYEKFRRRALERVESVSAGAEACKVTLTGTPPPRRSVIPYSREKICLITLCENGSGCSLARKFGDEPGFAGSFKVDTAVPVGYEKTWKDGERTPGIGLLTLFRRKRDIEYTEFIDRWHHGHTPLSLEIHPLWNYVRNVVVDRTAGDGIWYDAIVEEHCRTEKDLLSPLRFFGGFLKMPRNMYRVYTDVRRFIDYSSIESYCVEEFWLKS